MILVLMGIVIIVVLRRKKIARYSYLGLRQSFKDLGYDYTIKEYIFHSLIIMIGLLIFYLGTNTSLTYILFLVIISVVVIPYFIWLRRKQRYDQLLNEQVLLYVTTGILFIQEKKNSIKILSDLMELMNGSVKTCLKEALYIIDESTSYENGLSYIEDKLPFDSIKKFHALLISYKQDGGYNPDLYQYLYQSIEDLEINLNEYHIKKENHSRIFYGMWILNNMAIMALINVFQIDINVDNQTAFNLVNTGFYIMNLLTVIYYEKWCSKGVKIV